jgi:plastocyanin
MRVRCTILALGVASLGLLLLNPSTTEAQMMMSPRFFMPMRVPPSRVMVAPRAMFPPRFAPFPRHHFPRSFFPGSFLNSGFGYSPIPYTTGYGANSMPYTSSYGTAQMPYSAGYGASQMPYSAGYGASQMPYSAGYGSNSYASSAETQSASTVMLYDDYLQPKQLTVPVGTTVGWMNAGQHRHTVTSDTGLWDSRELDPGDGYAHTFAVPGTYPYHCRFHAREMGGVIIVK